ncbi:hypothetical protein LRP49_15495 [Enterovibrio sp. ZSDZ35]|uniref:Photosynthesis system II assembly factor Ycf48/Hcf136-like domain-containing protein n=1 Tax=Enterovibrio qingdaonensis TaxID=2899818 RepID=A0ABT5QNL0_9GAMM|nr:hypothetical protein [Enterovibrio sp. ZSDZ35]MDD1782576.1 hypothetical protein [Enterovibrio sp. ZSDZ35]
MLCLTYDFIKHHSHAISSINDINHLIVALDELGVNCDEEVRLLDIIVELIDNIDDFGLPVFEHTITLNCQSDVIPIAYLLDNISGVGFNSLYYLSEQYEKIIDILSVDALAKAEAREEFISKFFGNTFQGLTCCYRIRDLIQEFIGGSLHAITLYQREFLLEEQNEMLEHEESKNIEPISFDMTHPIISSHTFFDDPDTTQEQCVDYIRLFSLCVESENEIPHAAKEFLALLADKAASSQALNDMLAFVDSPYKYHELLPKLTALLDNEDKAYTWVMDAFYFQTLCNRPLENQSMKKLIDALPIPKFKIDFPHMRALLTIDGAQQVREIIQSIITKTNGWKNIVHYRSIDFSECFIEHQNLLQKAHSDAHNLSSEVMSVSFKSLDYLHFFEDDFTLVAKMASKARSSAYFIGRKSATSSLNDIRKKAYNFLEAQRSLLSKTNDLLAEWNIAALPQHSSISASNYDLDNSASNTHWASEFDHGINEMESALESFSSACSLGLEQIDFFCNGEFKTSALDIRKQKSRETQERIEEEKASKKTVPLTIDNQPHNLSILWHTIETPPCHPEDIQHIETNGEIWLIVDSSGQLYRSNNGTDWVDVSFNTCESTSSINAITHVNGTWLIFTGYNNQVLFSHDGESWTSGSSPVDKNVFGKHLTQNLFFFKDKWLWHIKERVEYTYTDKGLLFNTKETSSYEKSTLYCANSLTDTWVEWEDSFHFPTGTLVNRIQSLPDTHCLIAFCEYDWYYSRKNAHINTEPFVSYLNLSRKWRDCSWYSDKKNVKDPIITRINDSFMCFYDGHCLTSKKGYEWVETDLSFQVERTFASTHCHFFVSGNSVWVTNNGVTAKEICLENGQWNNITGNSSVLLGLFHPNTHETFLRLGKIILQPA